ncbi:unnamed protein product [Ambrosiozyma monospora]|uniref:Unnamed protein product n=1 Tax=Ambrosiozyma monospora TaxID=43982 RepID=A0ACB5SR06_AMBMO|nr:unnamed protein product [Ambrosiozyma monospora]
MRLVFGPYMILEYLDGMRPPETTEEFLKAEQELLKLARIGIIHGDIRKVNLLFNEKNGIAYVIDFEHVELARDGWEFPPDVVNKKLRERFPNELLNDC